MFIKQNDCRFIFLPHLILRSVVQWGISLMLITDDIIAIEAACSSPRYQQKRADAAHRLFFFHLNKLTQ